MPRFTAGSVAARAGFAAAVLALGAATAGAQTVANGPYYATPSWDQTLPAASRYIVLANFDNAAVLDRETGLVWERAPTLGSRNFQAALIECANLKIGNRAGWRLPSLPEMASLFDFAPGNAYGLPAGHPFTGLPAFGLLVLFTTSTDQAQSTPESRGLMELAVSPSMGGFFTVRDSVSDPQSRWCVRGSSPGTGT